MSQELTGASPLILVAEDNALLRDNIRDILEFNGYAVATVSNGQEALDFLGQTDRLPDLVLSDILMAEVDGCQLAEAIRAHPTWSHIPIVLFSGRQSADIKCPNPELVIDGYLSKPFSVPELLAVVESILS